MEAQKAFNTFLRGCGIHPAQDPHAKTRWALQFFARMTANDG
jgi:hypothetical protein